MPISYFAAQSQPTPLFPGGEAPALSPFMNFGNLPGLSGPQGMLLQMVMAPLVNSFGGNGVIPSQFSPTMNLYDQHRKVWNYQSQVQAMNRASQADQAVYQQALQGAARTAGIRMTPDRQRAVNMMSEDFAQFAPTLAQFMPETFEQMHGIRGSATLMAQQMFQGGRYALDPVTGRTGLSGDSAGLMAANIHERLYGPGANITEMRGLGAGRIGQLYNEMQLRGTGVRAMSRQEQLQSLAATQAGPTGDINQAMASLQALDKAGDPGLSNQLRTLESGRVAQRLKEMAGVVAAMKDIFGEAGQPNAPMNQLIEGLQVLTQGGMSSMSTTKMEQSVRETANLARRTGMGMDNFTQLMAQAAPQADALGVSRIALVSAAQHSAAFGQAYGALNGGAPAWGKQSKEFVTAQNNNLTLQAFGSTVANQLAMSARLADEYGLGGEAAALAAAVKEGKTTYNWQGAEKSVYSKQSDYSGMMIEGLTANGKMSRESAAGIVNQMRSQTARNQEFTSKYDLDISARRLQGKVDLEPRIGQEYRRAFNTIPGITDDQALAMSRQVAGNIFGMDPSKIEDMDAVMAAAGIDEKDPRRREQIRSALRLGYGNVDELVKRDPRLSGYKSAHNLFQMHNTRTMTESGLQREEARLESRIQSSMSGLARGTPLQRLMDAFINDPAGKSFKDLTKDVLGFIPTADTEAALLPLMTELKKEMEVANGPGSMAIRKEAANKIDKLTKKMQTEAETQGIGGSKVSREDTKKVLDALTGRTAGFVGDASDLYSRMSGDAKTVEMLGPNGVSKLMSLQAGADRLQVLADKHAGGDVNVLLAGSEDRTRARQLMLDSTSVNTKLSDLKRAEQDVLKGGTYAGKTGTAALAAIAEARKSVTEQGNTVRAAQENLRQKTGASTEALAASTDAGRWTSIEAAGLYAQQKAGLGEIDAAVKGGRSHWDMQAKEAQEVINRDGPLAAMGDPTAKLRVAEAQKKLTESKAGQAKVGADLKRFAAARAMSSEAVFDKLLGSLGSSFEGGDDARVKARREANLGLGSRSLMLSLARLKEITGEKDFSKYLQTGPSKDATAEERMLFQAVSPLGKLAGRKDLKEEEILSVLKDADKRAGRGDNAPGKDIIRLAGTLTIPNLGTGVLDATGNSRGGKNIV